nr:helix-turn-helix domain-containing protein [Clostridia bacterium]
LLFFTDVSNIICEHFVPCQGIKNILFYAEIMGVKFAERLKEVRIERNLSCKQLADNLQVSVRLVNFWERGERECGFEMLLRLSELLDVSIDYLLGKTNY